MTVYGYTLLDSAGAHCPDACAEPHGGIMFRTNGNRGDRRYKDVTY